MPIKLLQVIHSLDPKCGGPVESAKQMAISLIKKGHYIDTVSLDDPQNHGIKWKYGHYEALGPAVGNYGYTGKLKEWLDEHVNNYQAVLLRGLWQYSSFGSWRVLRRKKIPYFVYTHGMLDPWFKKKYPLKHIKKWFYWPWAEYRVLKDAEAVLFTCEEERILARKSFWLYSCNERVVHYGTASPPRLSEEEKKIFIDKYPELKTKKYFLFLGRIHPKKGCDLLIEAFSRIAKDNDKWRLVMAGPDQILWMKDLKKRAKVLNVESKILWPGLIEGNLKWSAYNNADLFVLPSHQENFGIAVVEALSCGVSVVISNKVNIWKEIVEDQVGYVCSDDIDSTAQMMKKWMDLSDSEKTNLSKKARNSFEERYEISKATDDLLNLFKKCKIPFE